MPRINKTGQLTDRELEELIEKSTITVLSINKNKNKQCKKKAKK